MADALGVLVIGLAAGTLGGLLGIGGGIVLMPFLRFCVGLSPAHAAGTCVVAMFGAVFAYVSLKFILSSGGVDA